MGHVIDTIRNVPIEEAIHLLEDAYQILHRSVLFAQKDLTKCERSWGSSMKRLNVPLEPQHKLIDKPSEKFVELINIMATAERTLSALNWMKQEFPFGIVRECHASTSDDSEGNDIVLSNSKGDVVARCEVCDVVSPNPGQNGKAVKDMKNLGCAERVPSDGVRRFICTSPEYATGLASPKRKWSSYHFRYSTFEANATDGTKMLEVVSARM